MTAAAGPSHFELTTDPGVFCDGLQPGDVLLFEKGLLVSSIIALADRRPVSHSAVVVATGGGDCRIVDAAFRDQPEEQVKESSLSALLDVRQSDARGEVRTVRAITARRAPAATADPAVGEEVARQASLFTSEARYALFDVASLAPYAFLRSNARSWRDGLSLVFHGLMHGARLALKRDRQPDLWSLSCSELVYRALAQVAEPTGAGTLAPAIDAPLVVDGRLRTDWRLPAGADHVELEELADEVARDKSPDAGAEWAGTRGIGHRPTLEEADGVTPGDLLDTPSLTTVAVLHRPLR
jgi:hypothetical protein